MKRITQNRLKIIDELPLVGNRRFLIIECIDCSDGFKVRSDYVNDSSGVCKSCRGESRRNPKTIEQAELKDLFKYDKNTGIFVRIKSVGYNAKSGDVPNNINIGGYLRIGINNKSYFAHRLAWLYVYGEFPHFIDHINHNRLDNRIDNLREVTSSENSRNMSILDRNTSGVTGVSFCNTKKRWRAVVCVSKKQIALGYFENKKDAISARKKANIEYGFHPNHGRANV